LKDLPWWVFGLRYLFGYNSTLESVGEMIIILKAEILKPVYERKKMQMTTKDQIKESRENNLKAQKLFNDNIQKVKPVNETDADKIKPDEPEKIEDLDEYEKVIRFETDDEFLDDDYFNGDEDKKDEE